MHQIQEDNPFMVIKNYRKMINRRDRYHKKRKPKQYPPTVIKTRSMEMRQRNHSFQQISESSCYLENIFSSSQYLDGKSYEVQLLQENIKESENIHTLDNLLDEEPNYEQSDILLYFSTQIEYDLDAYQMMQTN